MPEIPGRGYNPPARITSFGGIFCMAKISVVGTGYVGLVTGTCFADLGNTVTCIDIDTSKIDNLNRGILPIFEPGLEEMVERNRKAGRLQFTSGYEDGIPGADFVFIAVNTPSGAEGEADLKYTRAAAQSIAKSISRHTIIVNKSTVPIGTGDWVANIAEKHIRPGRQLRRRVQSRVPPGRVGDHRLHASGQGRARLHGPTAQRRRWRSCTGS